MDRTFLIQSILQYIKIFNWLYSLNGYLPLAENTVLIVLTNNSASLANDQLSM
jgi:hypothetical protein